MIIVWKEHVNNWLPDVLLIVSGQQWGSLAQRKTQEKHHHTFKCAKYNKAVTISKLW